MIAPDRSRAILPGMDVIRIAEIRDTPLSVDEVFAALGDPSAGGTSLFVGTVRNADSGRSVTALEYSAHPRPGPSCVG